MRDLKKINIFLFSFLLLSPFYTIAEPQKDSQQNRNTLHLIEGKANLETPRKKRSDLYLIKEEDSSKARYFTGDNPGFRATKNLTKRGHPYLISKEGDTILHSNIWLMDLVILEELLSSSEVNVNARNKDGNTALHLASLLMDALAIEKLLSHSDTDINATNKNEDTPLHLAVLTGDFETVKALIDNHANPNIKNSFGHTPLYRASYYGKTKPLKALLASKALDIDIVGENEWTSAQVALERKNKNALKLLLENGANPNIKDKNGETLVQRAIVYGDIEMMEIVLSFDNVNLNNVNTDGVSVLHKALKFENKPIIKELIKKGADIVALPFASASSENLKPEKAIALLNEIQADSVGDKTLSSRIDTQIKKLEELFENSASISCKNAVSK